MQPPHKCWTIKLKGWFRRYSRCYKSKYWRATEFHQIFSIDIEFFARNSYTVVPRRIAPKENRTLQRTISGFSGTAPRESTGKIEEKDQKRSPERTSRGPKRASWLCTGRTRGFEPNTAQFRAWTWSATLLLLVIATCASKNYSPLRTGHHGEPYLEFPGQHMSESAWYYCRCFRRGSDLPITPRRTTSK